MSIQLPQLKPWQGILILVNLYAVGILGFAWSVSQPYFAPLTPMTLIISYLMLLWFHGSFQPRFWLVTGIIFLAGYLVELAGVQTGVIFGEYAYGASLGLKLFNVPIIMGLNWVLLIYITSSTMQYSPLPWWLKAIFAAALMTLLDFFIEPFAIRFDLWSWAATEVPLQNYLAWFAIAAVMQLFYFKAKLVRRNILGPTLYVLQVVFFALVMQLT